MNLISLVLAALPLVAAFPQHAAREPPSTYLDLEEHFTLGHGPEMTEARMSILPISVSTTTHEAKTTEGIMSILPISVFTTDVVQSIPPYTEPTAPGPVTTEGFMSILPISVSATDVVRSIPSPRPQVPSNLPSPGPRTLKGLPRPRPQVTSKVHASILTISDATPESSSSTIPQTPHVPPTARPQVPPKETTVGAPTTLLKRRAPTTESKPPFDWWE